jgi:hypothetical protein
MTDRAHDDLTPSPVDDDAVDDLFSRAERRDRVVQLGVVLGYVGLSFVRPASLAPVARVAYHVTLAGLAAASTASGLTREPFTDPKITAGGAAGAAGVVIGFARTTEALDERLHRSIERTGVDRPRWIIAALSLSVGVSSLVLERVVTERRRALVEAEAAAVTAPAHSASNPH